jgi:UTP-glucose-1-phosphate uridylyltransferase
MMQTTSPTLLVMAAGMGSRYGGLKQIDPVGSHGQAILDYSIYDAIHAGFSKVVFVIRGEIERDFREAIGARFETHIPVEYVFQELDKLPAGFAVPPGRSKPWGTVHAVLMAADVVREPFAVINADDFYRAGSYQLLADHLGAATDDYAMVGFTLRNTLSDFGSVARGICQVDTAGMLKSVVELTHIERDGNGAKNTDSTGLVTHLSGDEPVSMNMWGLTPPIFDALREQFSSFLREHGSETNSECYLPNAMNALVAGGQAKIRVLRANESWFGVTYRADHSHVVEKIASMTAQGQYPESLWS